MAGPSADRITEWEGGSLSELVAMLQAAALPVRIEVKAPGTTDSNAGEVHLLAGGLADAFAGSLRRDDAMAALQRLEGARFMVESRLPDPESGSLSEPGPHEGSLKDRPLASLMRYCEEYVLTCRLEVWRGQDRAVISYRRGEIIGTVVGGSEGSECLPEVLGWTEGSYEITLPAPVLPQLPARKRDGATAGARPERKRHTTLPMAPTSGAKPEGSASPRTDAGTPSPGATAALPSRPTPASPAQPAGTSTPTRAAAPSSAPHSGAMQPATQQPAAKQPTAQPAPGEQPRDVAQRDPRPQPAPAAAISPAGARPMEPLQNEMTTRGTPPVPAVPLVPPSTYQPAQRPTLQGSAIPPGQAKPIAPAPGKPAGPPAPATPKSSPVAPQPAAQPAPKPATQPAPKPAAQPAPKPAAPAAQAPLKPAAPPLQAQAAQRPVAPPPQAQTAHRPPAPPPHPVDHGAQRPVVPPVAQTPQKPTPPPYPVTPSPAPTTAAPPPAQVAAPAETQQAGHAPKPITAAPGSNDLKPASGTIEAKPKHAHQLPPTTPPVQVAGDPLAPPSEQTPNPVVTADRAPTPRRARLVARKSVSEHPVRVYIFVGLAIGIGVVLAYWAYWYLPFGHH